MSVLYLQSLTQQQLCACRTFVRHIFHILISVHSKQITVFMECFYLNNREHVFTVLFCYVEFHGILIQSKHT
jgi:hypothetical protein